MVLYIPEGNATTVAIEHIPGDGLTVATFNWPLAQPSETYTIDATDHVSLELDRHFPIRPAKLTLTHTEDEASLDVITQLAGEALAQTIRIAPAVGFCTLNLTFTDENRQTIGRLQVASPSTPPLLKKASQNILAGIAATGRVTQPA